MYQIGYEGYKIKIQSNIEIIKKDVDFIPEEKEPEEMSMIMHIGKKNKK